MCPSRFEERLPSFSFCSVFVFLLCRLNLPSTVGRLAGWCRRRMASRGHGRRGKTLARHLERTTRHQELGADHCRVEPACFEVYSSCFLWFLDSASSLFCFVFDSYQRGVALALRLRNVARRKGRTGVAAAQGSASSVTLARFDCQTICFVVKSRHMLNVGCVGFENARRPFVLGSQLGLGCCHWHRGFQTHHGLSSQQRRCTCHSWLHGLHRRAHWHECRRSDSGTVEFGSEEVHVPRHAMATAIATCHAACDGFATRE